MGLLKVGRPLTWQDSRPHRAYVREHGIMQFLATFDRLKDTRNNELLYGDEVEYGVFRVDHVSKSAHLSLRAKEIKEELNKREGDHLHCVEGAHWHEEYGSWMVESTPRTPYSGYIRDLLRIEKNMRLRRCRILSALRARQASPGDNALGFQDATALTMSRSAD